MSKELTLEEKFLVVDEGGEFVGGDDPKKLVANLVGELDDSNLSVPFFFSLYKLDKRYEYRPPKSVMRGSLKELK